MIELQNLSDYSWNDRYRSGKNNLIHDFFIPALSRSKFYYRIAGFFSSTSIAAAARGISTFVENGEKMYLVVGSQLSENDVTAINDGLKNIDDVLHEKWEKCKSDFDKDIIKKRFEMLAWLIANGKLEIKVGINKDEDGNYLSSEQSLFHEKILIFEDYDGNMIQLDGSINETWRAWKVNRESFCVHHSWVEGQENYIETAKDDFDRVWANLDKTSEVMDLPEAIEKDLISIRPKNAPSPHDEIDFNTEELEHSLKKEKRLLRNYQEEAIQAWIDNDHIGILEMATGTGKTFTALYAIKELELKSKVLLIAVPQKELANQWTEECGFIFDDIQKRVVTCHSDTGWKKDLAREMHLSQKEGGFCIVIAVLDTFRSEIFIKIINKYLDDAYLIIDEVHEVGSTENRKLLPKLSRIKYRLGLSATPERLWDDEGNDAIERYFKGKPVFVWDMEKAITPPEGYDRCLCEYEYHLHDCSMTEEELEKYEELSAKIKRLLAVKTKGGRIKLKDIKGESSLTMLFNKRANIIKECEGKFTVLEKILDEYSNNLNKCLVYCNDKEHMEKVTKIILSKGFNCLKFYGELNSEKRENIFEHFKNGSVQFLVAIKCLDQGVDIPVCDSAIILTSSRNPREYIQRRGRILRLHENKRFAVVHDILVFPYPISDLEYCRKKLAEFESVIIKNQLERIDIFMKNAKNSAENCLKKIDYGDIIINATEEL